MSKRCKRYFLKDNEAKVLANRALDSLGIDFKQVSKGRICFEAVETEFATFILVNGRPLLTRVGGNLLPTLAFNEFLAKAPHITVDMGAIPHICNGADVMAPGIRRIEGNFEKGDLVLIIDEKHGKAIALGEILYGSNDVKDIKQGAMVRNIHFVGDRIWNFIKSPAYRTE